ncbi:MAG: arginase family protein [Candidatus Dormibacteraeota bacterium]|nr:arginase family protein [Candidatus Dormibacteraeota bacterium]
MTSMNLVGLKAWGGIPEAPLDSARIVLAGLAYDGSAVYRRGAAEAPAAVRQLSPVMPTLDERGRGLDRLSICDLGDLSLGDAVETGWQVAADRLATVPRDAFLTVLGGDHCCAIPILAAQARRHPDLAVLWVDAHPDLCDVSRGGRWTCGCALRRALEVAGLEPRRVVLAGCRDIDADELEYVREQGLVMVPTVDFANDFAAASTRVLDALGDRPVHVSLDIDVLDPAYAPGTEIASAGGWTTRQVLNLLAEANRRCPLVGLDICEISPNLDHADVTGLAALKVLFETWSAVAHR